MEVSFLLVSLWLIVPLSQGNNGLDDGLLGRWMLTKQAGLSDQKGLNPMYTNGEFVWQDGPDGRPRRSITLDGIIPVQDESLTVEHAFTWCGFVYNEDRAAVWFRLGNLNEHISVQMKASKMLRMWDGRNAIEYDVTSTANTWRFYCLTEDNLKDSTMRLYSDGVEVATAPVGSTSMKKNSDDSSVRVYDSRLSCVSFYKRRLSVVEVQQLREWCLKSDFTPPEGNHPDAVMNGLLARWMLTRKSGGADVMGKHPLSQATHSWHSGPDGRPSRSLYVDGTVHSPEHELQVGTAYTWCGYIYYQSRSDSLMFSFAGSGAFVFRYDTTHRHKAYDGVKTLYHSDSSLNSKWHFVCMSGDSAGDANLKLHYNGEEKASIFMNRNYNYSQVTARDSVSMNRLRMYCVSWYNRKLSEADMVKLQKWCMTSDMPQAHDVIGFNNSVTDGLVSRWMLTNTTGGADLTNKYPFTMNARSSHHCPNGVISRCGTIAGQLYPLDDGLILHAKFTICMFIYNNGGYNHEWFRDGSSSRFVIRFDSTDRIYVKVGNNAYHHGVSHTRSQWVFYCFLADFDDSLVMKLYANSKEVRSWNLDAASNPIMTDRNMYYIESAYSYCMSLYKRKLTSDEIEQLRVWCLRHADLHLGMPQKPNLHLEKTRKFLSNGLKARWMMSYYLKGIDVVGKSHVTMYPSGTAAGPDCLNSNVKPSHGFVLGNDGLKVSKAWTWCGYAYNQGQTNAVLFRFQSSLLIKLDAADHISINAAGKFVRFNFGERSRWVFFCFVTDAAEDKNIYYYKNAILTATVIPDADNPDYSTATAEDVYMENVYMSCLSWYGRALSNAEVVELHHWCLQWPYQDYLDTIKPVITDGLLGHWMLTPDTGGSDTLGKNPIAISSYGWSNDPLHNPSRALHVADDKGIIHNPQLTVTYAFTWCSFTRILRTNYRLLDFQNGKFRIYSHSNYYLKFYAPPINDDVNFNYIDSYWNFYCISLDTADDAVLRFYLSGRLVRSTNTPSFHNFSSATTDVEWVKFNNHYSYCMSFYNRKLSEAEMEKLRTWCLDSIGDKMAPDALNTGLVGRWMFDEMNGMSDTLGLHPATPSSQELITGPTGEPNSSSLITGTIKQADGLLKLTFAFTWCGFAYYESDASYFFLHHASWSYFGMGFNSEHEVYFTNGHNAITDIKLNLYHHKVWRFHCVTSDSTQYPTRHMRYYMDGITYKQTSVNHKADLRSETGGTIYYNKARLYCMSLYNRYLSGEEVNALRRWCLSPTLPTPKITVYGLADSCVVNSDVIVDNNNATCLVRDENLYLVELHYSAVYNQKLTVALFGTKVESLQVLISAVQTSGDAVTQQCEFSDVFSCKVTKNEIKLLIVGFTVEVELCDVKVN